MKISVIVPVYNVEQYLEQCLNSIIEQTYRDLEIIIVNDGSTDGSAKICDEFGRKDIRIRVVHQINGGVSSARNIGITLATGDYITFVDSDDWLEKEMYEKMIAATYSNVNPNVIMCDFINEKKNSTENITANIHCGRYDKKEIIDELYPTLLVTEDLGRVPIVSVWSCFFKKEILHNYNIFFDVSLKYAEDYLFMAEVILHSDSFYYLKGNYLYHYRQYEQSRSKEYQPEWWDNLLSLNIKLKELVSSNKDYDFSRQVKLQLIHSALFLSSAIFQNDKMKKKEKTYFLSTLFNHPALESAFFNLNFKKQPLGLMIVLYLLKHKMAIGYLVIRNLMKIKK